LKSRTGKKKKKRKDKRKRERIFRGLISRLSPLILTFFPSSAVREKREEETEEKKKEIKRENHAFFTANHRSC